MRALMLLLLCGSVFAGEGMIAKSENEHISLTKEKCKDQAGLRFTAHVNGKNEAGYWTLSENGFVVARYDDKTIYVYPIVIFRPATGV